MIRPLFVICICIWFVFAFTGCGTYADKPPAPPRCRTVHRLPGGATCKIKEHSFGVVLFRECSDGANHINPGSWTDLKVCE